MSTNQNVQAQNGERGPSYWDVERAAERIRSEWGVGLFLALTPPMYVKSSGTKTSWNCQLYVWRLGTAEIPHPVAARRWGAGGSFKTAPAAMLTALLDYEATRELEERVKAAQARF